MASGPVLVISARSQLKEALDTALAFADRQTVHFAPAATLDIDLEDPWAAVVDLTDPEGGDAFSESQVGALCAGLRHAFPNLPIFLLSEAGRSITKAAQALDLDADGLLRLPTPTSHLMEAIAAAHGVEAPRVPKSLVLGDDPEAYDDVTVPDLSGVKRAGPNTGTLNRLGDLFDPTREGANAAQEAAEVDPNKTFEGSENYEAGEGEGEGEGEIEPKAALVQRVERLRKTRAARRVAPSEVLRDVTERITADELEHALSQSGGEPVTAEGDPIPDDPIPDDPIADVDAPDAHHPGSALSDVIDDALGDEEVPSLAGGVPLVAESSGSLEAPSDEDSAVEAAVASMDRGYDSVDGNLDELMEGAVDEADLKVQRMALRARRRAESLAEQEPIEDEEGDNAQTIDSDVAAHARPEDEATVPSLTGPGADVSGSLPDSLGPLEETLGDDAEDPGLQTSPAALASFEEEKTPSEDLMVTAPTVSAEPEQSDSASSEDISSSGEGSSEESSSEDGAAEHEVGEVLGQVEGAPEQEGAPSAAQAQDTPEDESGGEQQTENGGATDPAPVDFAATADESVQSDDDLVDGKDDSEEELDLDKSVVDSPDLEVTAERSLAQGRLAAATEAVRAELETQAEVRLRQALEDAAAQHREMQAQLREELEQKLLAEQEERVRLADELEQARSAAADERAQREQDLQEAEERAASAAEQARSDAENAQERAAEAERDAEERAERAREAAEAAEAKAEQIERDARERAAQIKAEAEEAEERAKNDAARRLEENASELESRLRQEAEERIASALADQREQDAVERDQAVAEARREAEEEALRFAEEQVEEVRREAAQRTEARVQEALAESDARAVQEREALEAQLRSELEESSAKQLEKLTLEAEGKARDAETRARDDTRREVEAQLEIALAHQAELGEKERQALAAKMREEAEHQAEARVAEAVSKARAQAKTLLSETQKAAEARIAKEIQVREEKDRREREALEKSIRQDESRRAKKRIAKEVGAARTEIEHEATRVAEERARLEVAEAEARLKLEAEEQARVEVAKAEARIKEEAEESVRSQLEVERDAVEKRIGDLEKQLTHAAQAHLQEELARQEEEHHRLTTLVEERVREQTVASTRAALEVQVAELESKARIEAESRAQDQMNALLQQREEAEARVRARLSFVSGRFGSAYDDLRGAPGEVGADDWAEGAERTQPLYRIPFSQEGSDVPVEPPEPPPLKALEPAEGVFGQGEIGALLFSAHYLEVTGRLDLAHEDGRLRTIFLELGEPVAFHSTLARDRPEESLLKAGLITAARHSELRAADPMSARRLCATLVEDGALKVHELFVAVRGVFTEQLLSVLEWDQGAFRYLEERAPPADRVRLVQPFDAIVADGLRRKYDEERLWRVLGGPATILGPDERAPRLPPLGPAERGAAALIDGTRSLEDITLEIMAPADIVLRTALVLLSCGAARMIARGLPDSPEARIAERARNVQIDAARIEDRLRIAREGDYFSFLGVDRECTSYEVQRAADQLHQRFDPARFTDPAFSDLRAALTEIVEVIRDAKAVLSDEHLKEAYRRNLRPTRARAAQRKAAS